jgi:hypothetical protein
LAALAAWVSIYYRKKIPQRRAPNPKILSIIDPRFIKELDDSGFIIIFTRQRLSSGPPHHGRREMFD